MGGVAQGSWYSTTTGLLTAAAVFVVVVVVVVVVVRPVPRSAAKLAFVLSFLPAEPPPLKKSLPRSASSHPIPPTSSLQSQRTSSTSPPSSKPK